MNRLPSKRPRVRLDSSSYKQLCQGVLERDGWKCQVCGSSRNLEVHHQRFRSQQGDDNDQNMITLCSECHHKTHHPPHARKWPEQKADSAILSRTHSIQFGFPASIVAKSREELRSRVMKDDPRNCAVLSVVGRTTWRWFVRWTCEYSR